MKKKLNESGGIPDDILKMSFEEAFLELKAATDRLEGEEIDLESAIAEYQRAASLARHCADKLDKAEQRIRVLTESDGIVKLSSLDSEEHGPD